MKSERPFPTSRPGVIANPETQPPDPAGGGHRRMAAPAAQVHALAGRVQPRQPGDHFGFVQGFRGNHPLRRQLQSHRHRPVGCGKGAGGESTAGYPLHRLAFAAMGLAGERGDFAKMQGDVQVRITVAHGQKRAGSHLVKAQLLMELPGQGPLQRLAGLHLATGKLPQATLMLVLGTAAQAEAVVAVRNNAGDDDDFRQRHGGHRLRCGIRR